MATELREQRFEITARVVVTGYTAEGTRDYIEDVLRYEPEVAEVRAVWLSGGAQRAA